MVLIRLHKQADLMETKVDHTKDRKLALGKNGCHRPSDLSSRSIVVVTQRVSE